jgi:hypothetical protein
MPQAPSPAPDGPAISAPIDTAGPAFEAAHKAMLRAPKIQHDFPSHIDKPPPPTPGWLKALATVLEPLGHIMPYLFWGGIALGVAFILYLIVREMGGFAWTRKPKKAAAEAEYRPDARTAAVLLADADELAAQGRFAEAVHSLLLRSIEDMRKRRPRALTPALTARDITVLPALPEPARPAFAAMAQAVERSLFGGRPVDRAEFDACRKSYEDFAFPKAWS